jgi:hypothetical protein
MPWPPVVDEPVVVPVVVPVIVPVVVFEPRPAPPFVETGGGVDVVVVAPTGGGAPPELDVVTPPELPVGVVAVDVVVVDDDVVLELVVVVADDVGTVSAGAPLVSVVPAPPLPHADTDTAVSTPAANAAIAAVRLSRRNMGTFRRSGARG